jgi:metallo-beta-lactamase family protein
VEFDVPRSWVGTIDGFSGHAARNTLLQFAREVAPASIHLIHGERTTISEFRDFLQGNTEAMVSPAEEGVKVPVTWGGTKSPMGVEYDDDDGVATEEGEPFTPAQEERLRELIREEMQNMMLNAFAGPTGGDDE